ncbi:MAG: hypothetical protein LBR06_03520 [Bacteroidales bacterium]|jgi:hypothetical protein|nr:hypothetical protein [Bacteroidales bacterium]
MKIPLILLTLAMLAGCGSTPQKSSINRGRIPFASVSAAKNRQQPQTPEMKVKSVSKDQKFVLNSRNKAMLGSGKRQTVHEFSLPKNTKAWHYAIRASSEEDPVKLNLEASFKGVATLTPNITIPKGTNYCDVFLVDSQEIADKFGKGEYPLPSYIKEHSRENFAEGVVTVRNPASEKYWLCIRNPHTVHKVIVMLDIVAIVETGNNE